VCRNGDQKRVGRQHINFEGKHGGQCHTDNTMVKYSLPERGQCAPDTAVGTNGCTWKAHQLVRTVSVSCIEERMKQVCGKGEGQDIGDATAILTAALASDNVSVGGCPNALEPEK